MIWFIWVNRLSSLHNQYKPQVIWWLMRNYHNKQKWEKLLSVMLIFAIWLLLMSVSLLEDYHQYTGQHFTLFFTILFKWISRFCYGQCKHCMPRKHCYSLYNIVGHCPWSTILITYLVNYCKITVYFTGCDHYRHTVLLNHTSNSL